MNYDTQPQSFVERQLRQLVVLPPAAYDPCDRVDFIHEPDLDLLQGDRT